MNPSKFESKWPRTSGRGTALRGKQSAKLRPDQFEKRWQRIWEKERVYQPDLLKAKRPYYNLMMFPYPSAEGLHVGNMYAFTGADINGRFQRMKGYDVFEPIGLDGFGIHSENYAIKIGKHPAVQAKVSQKNYYRQLHAIGGGFSWENTLETYDPEYYRWTQWIFVAMFKHGLAYRKKSQVNFCPSCKTVLSDEQVINGACERCKTIVEKRQMQQWFFKITDYAQRLLQNTFKESFQWTEKVKTGQRNWIGKKEGINITYPLLDEQGDQVGEVTCFTTRPDTNFGATFVVIGPEHPLVDQLLSGHLDGQKALRPDLVAQRVKEIREYVERAKKTSEMDRIAQGKKKTGVATGLYAVNQLNDYKMPIYISDFVIGNVGTGAVVGVPGHDMRDFEFAKEFKLPIVRVVVGQDRDISDITLSEQVQEEEGIMVNSRFLDGKDIHDAIKLMLDYLEKKDWGKRVTTYKLRDWCISRQRYWGAPIPMIYCSNCASQGQSWFTSKEAITSSENLKLKIGNSAWAAGWYPVPEDQLPVKLPPMNDWKPEGTGNGPLAKVKSFIETKCPHCGSNAERETDVCDTFLDSSWYFLRYPSVNIKHKTYNIEQRKVETPRGWQAERREAMTPPTVEGSNLPWDSKITQKWLPVTQYIGGAEHTVLHLLYARFVWMAMRDFGYLDFSAQGVDPRSISLGLRPASGWDEPFSRFYAHGLIIAEGAKMSKSRGNVIVPDVYIKQYGADALRTYLMFLGPFDQGGDFRDTGIAGMYRFLNRVWRLVDTFIEQGKAKTPRVWPEGFTLSIEGTPPTVEESDDLTRSMHRTIKEVTEDLENFRYNTAIAHIMEYVNAMLGVNGQVSNVTIEAIETLLLLLAPFAPHLTEELWQKLRSDKDTSEVARRVYPEHRRDSSDFVPTKSVLRPTQSDGGGISKTTFSSIHLHPWPTFDPKFLVEDTVTIVVQVNGKVRDTLKIKISNLPRSDRDQQTAIEELAKKSEKITKYLEGATISKVIFVPGKLLNFVV